MNIKAQKMPNSYTTQILDTCMGIDKRLKKVFSNEPNIYVSNLSV